MKLPEKKEKTMFSGFKQLSKMSLLEYLLTLLMMVAVLLVVVFYIFNSFYKVVKDQTLNDGLSNVSMVAERLDHVLGKAMDAVNVTSYTLETMIEPSRKSLQEFLTVQNKIYSASVENSFSAMYVQYDSIFVSGDGWVPPDEYNVQNRSWYKEALQHPGQLILSAPYEDADTKRYVVSISRSFANGRGVLSIDLQADLFQRLTSIATQTGLINCFIASRDGFIIGSVDEKIRLKNYLKLDNWQTEQANLMKRILQNETRDTSKLSSYDRNVVESVVNGSNQMAFYQVIKKDFLVVMTVDEAELYESVQRILMLSIILSLFVILVVGAFVTTSYINGAVASRSAREQLKMKKEIQKNFNIINTLAAYFDAVIYVDAVTKKVIPYSLGKALKEKLGPAMGKDGLNLSYEQAMMLLVHSIIHPDERGALLPNLVFESVVENLKNKKSFSFQCQALEFGQYCYHKVMFIHSGSSDEVSSFVVAIADVDEEVRRIQSYQNDLEEAKKRAEDANQAKSSFLANMSHEIRTPINAIMGMNEMILRESENPQIHSYSEDIRGASQILLSIINDILDFSKIEAGKMEIVEAEYNIGSVLNDITAMISIKAEQKGLALGVKVDESIPSLMRGDAVRIQQVMLNLLNNAVKYTEKGSIEFRMSVIERRNNEVTLQIQVEDTGIGIREQDQSMLFKSFQRLDIVQNRTIEGTGLGLAITSKLVEYMHGSISVKSHYGKGSCFTVTLPQTVVDNAPIGNFDKHFQNLKNTVDLDKLSFTASEAKILVVDDNSMNLRVAQHLMKHLEVQVTTCSGGMECLELMKKERFDIIFLDHMMPGMDGMETLKLSKKLFGNKCAKAPVIALTANAIVGAKDMYLKAGFDGYLCKPIKMKDLEKTLLKFLPAELVKVSAAVEDSANG